MLQNKIRYLILIILMGFLSILYNEYVMGIIFLTILIIPFCLFAILCFCYGMVRAELVSGVHVANKGEVIPISVRLHNPTIFPISNITILLKYKNAYSGKQYKKEYSFSLDRKTDTTVICNLQSEFAGNLEITLAGIRLYDFLKIFSLRRKLNGQIKIAILPFFYEMLENTPIRKSNRIIESDYYSPVKRGDDPSEVFAIREYTEGDRPQRIHWKLSIKQGQLMIKDFSDPQNCSVLIFADLQAPAGAEALRYMDALLECSLSLSYSLIMQKQIHYLAWYGKKHGACTRVRIAQEKDLFEAVDGLLAAEILQGAARDLTAYLAEHPNDQYTDLFYVTGDISEEKLNAMSMLHADRRQLFHISGAAFTPGAEDFCDTDRQAVLAGYKEDAAEMGIGFITMDIGNIKNEIEQLNLS